MHWRSWEWLTTPKTMGGMGFRDMQLFNQAMLGKQCWRILTVPNSLCARVLKGRYFPKCTFWNAPQPRSSSFTWRSIMYGKELLLKGIIWRIGDGKCIRIIKDHWVQESHLLKPTVFIPEDLKVHSLIDGTTCSWNEEVVRLCFKEDDAEKILQIPLCLTPCEDFPAWPYTKTGTYTVKSAYYLVRMESFHVFLGENGRGETSNQNETSKCWRRLWAIQAPPKMKIVLWRIVHNCLPTGTQLKQRNILTFDACCFCGREETVEHVFFMCQYASEVWRQVRKCFAINYKPHVFIRQWLFDFLDGAKDYEATALTITIWHIWEARNAVRNGENMMHPRSIAERAIAYTEMFMLHTTKQPTTQRCESNCSVPRWTPPPIGWLMVNVDAAVFKNPPRIGVGAVIRDHTGAFKMAFCKLLHTIYDPEMAEAMAIRCAIVSTKEKDLQNIIVASDCQNIIKKIQAPVMDRSKVGAIVRDVKNLVSNALVSFVYIRRGCN